MYSIYIIFNNTHRQWFICDDYKYNNGCFKIIDEEVEYQKGKKIKRDLMFPLSTIKHIQIYVTTDIDNIKDLDKYIINGL